MNEEAEKYFNEGLEELKKGNEQEAVVLFTKTIEIDKTFTNAFYYRGASYADLFFEKLTRVERQRHDEKYGPSPTVIKGAYGQEIDVRDLEVMVYDSDQLDEVKKEVGERYGALMDNSISDHMHVYQQNPREHETLIEMLGNMFWSGRYEEMFKLCQTLPYDVVPIGAWYGFASYLIEDKGDLEKDKNLHLVDHSIYYFGRCITELKKRYSGHPKIDVTSKDFYNLFEEEEREIYLNSLSNICETALNHDRVSDLKEALTEMFLMGERDAYRYLERLFDRLSIALEQPNKDGLLESLVDNFEEMEPEEAYREVKSIVDETVSLVKDFVVAELKTQFGEKWKETLEFRVHDQAKYTVYESIEKDRRGRSDQEEQPFEDVIDEKKVYHIVLKYWDLLFKQCFLLKHDFENHYYFRICKLARDKSIAHNYDGKISNFAYSNLLEMKLARSYLKRSIEKYYKKKGRSTDE